MSQGGRMNANALLPGVIGVTRIAGSLILRLSVTILTLFFAFPFSAFGSGEIETLFQSCPEWQQRIFTIEEQPQNPLAPWCWAAATHNVTAYVYYRKYPALDTSQCQMAEIMAKRLDNGTPRPLTCCDADRDPALGDKRGQGESHNFCKTEWWPEQIMDALTFSYSPPLTLNQAGERPPSTYQPLKWTEVTNEICQNRPYISIIGSDLATHAVVVHGFTRHRLGHLSLGEVQVYDPQSDDSYSDAARYGSLLHPGQPTGTSANGDTHFGDTYNVHRIAPVVKPPEPPPDLPPDGLRPHPEVTIPQIRKSGPEPLPPLGK